MPLESILTDTATAPPISPQLAHELEDLAREKTPDAVRRLVSRAFETLEPRRALITSGLGMEGCVLLDVLAPLGLPLRVVFLDTGFHFEETLDLLSRLGEHYPTLDFETLRPRLTPAEQAAQEGEQLWLTAPDRCCHLRKVEPLEEHFKGSDLWISAITRSQSPARAEQPVLASDSRFGVAKLSPLVAWHRRDVWRHVETFKVPFHPLHLQGYPTVSCRHCTLPVPGAGPADYSRAGRWSASSKTECGLHDGTDHSDVAVDRDEDQRQDFTASLPKTSHPKTSSPLGSR